MTDYTPILNIAEVASNQNQKEVTINTAVAILEAASNDGLPISLASADHSLTIDEFTKNFIFILSGNTAARNLNTPAASGSFTGKRAFLVSNTGSHAVTVKPGGSGTGDATVTAGQAAFLYCDGTTITVLSSGAAPVAGASFTSLSDVPSSYSTDGLKGVRVKTTEDGLEFFVIPASLGFSISGKPDASQVINLGVTQSWKLSIGLPGSVFFTGTDPAATTVYNFNKISGGTITSIGSVSIANTGIATVTFASAVTFAAGDILQIVCPSSQDSACANVSMTFKGTLQ